MLTLLLSDFGLFVGRFHPLLVHLPIGFLLLAVVLEWWPSDKLRPAIRVSWVLGALSAVAAAVCGWLLATEAGAGDTLFWHRWLGVSVAVLAVAGVWLTRDGGKLARGYGLLTAVLLGVAGHQGGNLTHGSDYLVEHAPAPVQRLAGYGGANDELRDWSAVNTDSIYLYAAFLQPALETSCTRCHDGGKQNGGLRLDQPHLAFRGGDSGPLLVAGSPWESEWLRRVTLPQDHAKAMPPNGEGWDYVSVELLRHWIEAGADTLYRLTPDAASPELKKLLLRDRGLELRTKQFVETVTAPALAPADRKTLTDLNWALTDLQPGGGALEAKAVPGKPLDPEALGRLADLAAEQVVYLSLDRQPIDDAAAATLARFPNLNRLGLHQTAVTEKAVASLAGLQHLESLNLYGTKVGDGVFTTLERLPALRRVYLWQTMVSPTAAAAYAEAHPRVAVDTGFAFVPVNNTTK